MLRRCKLESCGNVFSVRLTNARSAARQYCGRTCAAHDQPEYRATSERIRQCTLYLSLGFTPEQVYKDFIEGEVNPVTFLKQLERRKETKVASVFRRWLTDIGLVKRRRHNAVRAA